MLTRAFYTEECKLTTSPVDTGGQQDQACIQRVSLDGLRVKSFLAMSFLMISVHPADVMTALMDYLRPISCSGRHLLVGKTLYQLEPRPALVSLPGRQTQDSSDERQSWLRLFLTGNSKMFYHFFHTSVSSHTEL